MNEDNVKALYDALHSTADLGTYDEFKGRMAIPENRKAFYDAVHPHADLGTYDDFESRLKKKVDGEGSPLPAENTSTTTSQEGNGLTEGSPVADALKLGTPQNLPTSTNSSMFDANLTDPNQRQDSPTPVKIESHPLSYYQENSKNPYLELAKGAKDVAEYGLQKAKQMSAAAQQEVVNLGSDAANVINHPIDAFSTTPKSGILREANDIGTQGFNGLTQMGEGFYNMIRQSNDVTAALMPNFSHTDGQTPVLNAENIGLGAVKTGMSALRVIPESAPIMLAWQKGGEVLPEEISQTLFNPVTSIGKTLGYDMNPTTEQGKKGLEFANIFGSMAVLGMGEKYFEGKGIDPKELSEKIANNQPLNQAEGELQAEALSTVTPEIISKAEEVAAAKQHIPDNVPHEKKIQISPIVNAREKISSNIAELDSHIAELDKQKAEIENSPSYQDPLFTETHDKDLAEIDDNKKEAEKTKKELESHIETLNEEGKKILSSDEPPPEIPEVKVESTPVEVPEEMPPVIEETPPAEPPVEAKPEVPEKSAIEVASDLKKKRATQFKANRYKAFDNIEPETPEQRVLHHFSTGGKINTEDAVRETGFKGNSPELLGKTSKTAPTIDQLVSDILNSHDSDLGADKQGELRNQVIDILSNKSIKDVGQELLSHFPKDEDMQAKYEEFQRQHMDDDEVAKELSDRDREKIDDNDNHDDILHSFDVIDKTEIDQKHHTALVKDIEDNYTDKDGNVDWDALYEAHKKGELNLPDEANNILNDRIYENSDIKADESNQSGKANPESTGSEKADGSTIPKGEGSGGKSRPDSGETSSSGSKGAKETEIKESFKKVADKIRSFKSDPFEGLTDADGKPIKIDFSGISKNDILEAIAKGIEKTGDVAQSIHDAIKDHDWFKGLDKDSQEAVKKQLQDKFEKEEPRLVGVSHKSLGKIAEKLGLEQPETGDVLSPKEYAARGKLLIDNGANPEEVASEFKDTGKVDEDMISVARAHLENLYKLADEAKSKFGEKSPEFSEALKGVNDWSKEVVKPMGTKFAKLGRALQGETDIDTGSFVQSLHAFEEKAGRPATPTERAKIEELSKQVSDLTQKIKDGEAKITKAIDEAVKKALEDEKRKTPSTKGREGANKLAAKIRGLKSKVWLDSEGNPIEVHKSGIDMDGIIEAVAKAVEKAGKKLDDYTDLINDVLSKHEMSDKDREAIKNQLIDHLNDDEKETPGEKAIKRLEKKLKDIEEGTEKEPRKKTEYSDEEKSQITDLKKQIQDLNDDEKVKQMQKDFVDKTDSKFTMNQVKDIWDYAKREYIDKGRSFNDMLVGVSKELGLSTKQVRDAITSPKGLQRISDDMYILQNRRRSAVSQASRYIEEANETKVQKALKALPNAFFQLKTFGHGTVGMITHAGSNIFRPSGWKNYWTNFGRQFKYSFGGLGKKGLAKYEMAMQDLQNEPNYPMWKRSGLKVDPTDTRTDDYMAPANTKLFGRINDMGTRGFNALKVYRLEAANQIYEGLSNVEKADPETLKTIADLVNNSTGTNSLKVHNAANVALFAPRLEASRWTRLIIHPAKAAHTFYNWENATIAEKVQAKLVARRSGEFLATAAIMLAANQAFLSAMGSKQKINVTDPSKSDWMKFKGFDHTLDVSGGMLNTARFIGSLVSTTWKDRKELKGDSKWDAEKSLIGNYLRGKASPFMATGIDLISHHDYAGNTLPMFDDKPDRKYAHNMTPVEYIFDNAPIPVAEAFKSMKESMKEKGMSDVQATDILNGFIMGALEGGTGARASTDYSEKEGTGKPQTIEQQIKSQTEGINKQIKAQTKIKL